MAEPRASPGPSPFRQIAETRLRILEDGLSRVAADLTTMPALLGDLIEAAQSINQAADAAGYPSISGVALRLEEVLEGLESGRIQPHVQIRTALSDAVSTLHGYLASALELAGPISPPAETGPPALSAHTGATVTPPNPGPHPTFASRGSPVSQPAPAPPPPPDWTTLAQVYERSSDLLAEVERLRAAIETLRAAAAGEPGAPALAPVYQLALNASRIGLDLRPLLAALGVSLARQRGEQPLADGLLPVLVVRIAGQPFALAQPAVLSRQAIDRTRLFRLGGQTWAPVGARHLPITRLARALGLPEPPDAALPMGIVLVLRGEPPRAWLVDAVEGAYSALPTTVARPWPGQPLLAGNVLLPDGTVLLLLNPEAVV